MAFGNFKSLTPTRNFQLHATASAVYTATSSAEIVSIELHNMAGATSWAKIFYPFSGSADGTISTYERLSETLPSGGTLEYKRTPITLNTGESIFAQAQTTSSINISIIGRVE